MVDHHATDATDATDTMAAMTDEALLAAWRGQDKRAGAVLLTRHHASIARFFNRRLGPDTDDLVQATFLGLLEGLERFRGESSIRTLLFAVARNKLNRYLRDLTRDRKRFDSSKDSIAAFDSTPTHKLGVIDENRLLLLALRELPLDTQMMFELHYWESMKIEDIALVLDEKPGTVKSRMHRGRKQLELLMQRLAESPEQLTSSVSSLSKWAERLQEEIGDVT